MKTASYNGSRKTYLCPATNIYDIKIKARICDPTSPSPSSLSLSRGVNQKTLTTETKRRHGLFNDEEGSLDTSKGIW